MPTDQLTDEQRQLLAQMQADMRQQPTQLNEVPWNEQTPAQRQQTWLQRQRQAQIQQQQQQQWTQTQPVQQPKAQPYQHREQRQRTVAASNSAAANRSRAGGTAEQDSNRRQRRSLASRRSRRRAPKPKRQRKRRAPRWMVQCGSFKGAEQAETVRAQLAFEGFDSRITTNNGWNRVVIGPVKGKENADGTISRLKVAGHTNCIRLASGG